jgi:hypothetical protein
VVGIIDHAHLVGFGVTHPQARFGGRFHEGNSL